VREDGSALLAVGQLLDLGGLCLACDSLVAQKRPQPLNF